MRVRLPSAASAPSAGLALGLAGIFALAAHYGDASPEGFASWPLASVFTAERLLPLIGLGVLLGQMPARWRLAAAALVIAGGVAGVLLRHPVYDLLAPVRGAAAHLFLTGPIACVLVGAILVWPPRFRTVLALALAVPLGAALAIAVILGDPTLHERGYRIAAFTVEIWFVVVVALAAAGLAAAWSVTASRIAASWLIAIGLLYGGAHIASGKTVLEPPGFPPLDGPGEDAGFARVLPALDAAKVAEGE